MRRSSVKSFLSAQAFQLAGAALAASAFFSSPATADEIVDSAGRVVTVPSHVERVFAAGPPASVLIYVLAPDRLTGWPRALRPEERDYVAAPYRDLPELGRLTGRGDTVNLEVMLSAKPDLIVDFGSVRDTYVSLADRVQAQTNIPYLLVDGRFDATPQALRLVGGALGVGDRAEALAAYVEDTFRELDTTLAAVPESERPRVYLARGPDGLETGLKGSINTEIIERAGGINVAVDPGRQGISRVSLEQVLAWNPDTIVTWDPIFYEAVWSDPSWASVEAVRRGRVYLSPTAPFGWIDRPPSLNRVMGLKWLSRVFFPDRFPDDLADQTRAFYKRVYHVDLDEDALNRLLAWSRGRKP